jgi:perosamine synthetase
VHAGARPVFVEVDERTFNLTAATVKPAIGARTKAILAVHQVGLPAELDELAALAREHDLILVEDAACAIGSDYRGARVGRPHGVAACFSFHPRKVLSTGEGGMITTADAQLAARLRRLRHHGMSVSDLDRHRARDRYLHESYSEIGFNFRMSDLQAAVGIVQLGRIEELLARRRHLAARYTAALSTVKGIEPPFVPAHCGPNFQSYVVRLPGAGRAGRDRAIDTLLRAGVTTRPGVMAAHREPAYASGAWQLPVTERTSDETLVLPLYHQLSEDDQDRVVAALRALEI